MKSEVNLTLSVFTTLLLGLVVSGCCGVKVEHGPLGGNSLKPASKKEPFHLDRGQSLTVIASRIGGKCETPLQIKSSKWSQYMPMSLVDDDADKYEYTFTGEDVNDTFQYVIRKATEGGGPYKIIVNGPPQCLGPCKKGYECALQYRKRELEAYRLVVLLHPMSDPERAEYLRGFKTAYTEADDAVQGEKCVDILKKSLLGGIYEQAFGHGQKHVNSEVPDAGVQDFMRRAVGLSVATTLGWEAGYIEGFVNGKFDPGVHDKESLYEEAETMYRVLRAGAAL